MQAGTASNQERCCESAKVANEMGVMYVYKITMTARIIDGDEKNVMCARLCVKIAEARRRADWRWVKQDSVKPRRSAVVE